jgi:hypothetical protein
VENDERDLLGVLKFELNFLEKGGYGRTPRERWRRPMIFQDSPACMNYDTKENPGPCEDCVLMELMPPQQRAGNLPCYQIPLNAAGETLNSLYRYGEDTDIEETYGAWLRTVIARLEELTKDAVRNERPLPASMPSVVRGIALHEPLHPKCANPACRASFHWLSGGKFFRFRGSQVSGAAENLNAISAPANSHRVKHFWLCEMCSQVYTLAYCEEHGVVIQARLSALATSEDPNEVAAA